MVRVVRVVREGVECPSLSPDGRRLVFKSRRFESGRQLWGRTCSIWRPAARRPSTGRCAASTTRQFGSTTSTFSLYALPEDRTPATGGSDLWLMEDRPVAAPHKLLEQAPSPAVVR